MKRRLEGGWLIHKQAALMLLAALFCAGLSVGFALATFLLVWR